MIEAAAPVATGELAVERLATLDDADAVTQLRRLRGVGRWTAEYVLLRGLGRLNAFPGDDVGAQDNLRRWLSLSEPLDFDYSGVQAALARWQPYRGLVYFHPLLEHLDEVGYLDTST